MERVRYKRYYTVADIDCGIVEAYMSPGGVVSFSWHLVLW